MADESPPPEMIEYLRRIGKKYGASGGRVAAQGLTPAQRKRRASKAGKGNLVKLTPKERSERARTAARERWSKKRKKKADK